MRHSISLLVSYYGTTPWQPARCTTAQCPNHGLSLVVKFTKQNKKTITELRILQMTSLFVLLATCDGNTASMIRIDIVFGREASSVLASLVLLSQKTGDSARSFLSQTLADHWPNNPHEPFFLGTSVKINTIRDLIGQHTGHRQLKTFW